MRHFILYVVKYVLLYLLISINIITIFYVSERISVVIRIPVLSITTGLEAQISMKSKSLNDSTGILISGMVRRFKFEIFTMIFSKIE